MGLSPSAVPHGRLEAAILKYLIIALVLCTAIPAKATGIQQAFLVQNSGWMEPFYVDAASQLKPLVAAVAGAVTTTEDKVFTLAFSQSSNTNVSPALLGQGQGAADLARQLGPLNLARRSNGGALADTDFQEAITKTITDYFKAAPGILWIFTNNKNSPNNDLQTAERNRDFYRLLHLEPSITKTLVFPLKMPVQGKFYAAKGLMVYALAYGQPASEALNRIIAEGRIAKVLTNAPARIKPVDQDPVRIVPEMVKNTTNVRVTLGADQQTLMLDVDAANLVPSVTLQASMQNQFYPYMIRSAKVEATLVSAGARSEIHVSPAAIQNLQPGAKQSIEVQFSLPMAQVPTPWSAQALSAMGKQVILPMTVELGLTAQQLLLSDRFVADLRDIFPGDPISEVFTPPESARTSKSNVPFLVRIQYPLTPVLLIMGAILALFASLVVLGLAASQSKRYELTVDGTRRHIVLKPFVRLAVKDGEGRQVGEVKRGIGKPRVVSVVEGRALSFTGR